MPNSRRLWKTVVSIWTDYDPTHVELEDLAREATSGDAISEGGVEGIYSLDCGTIPEGVLSFFGELEDDAEF